MSINENDFADLIPKMRAAVELEHRKMAERMSWESNSVLVANSVGAHMKKTEDYQEKSLQILQSIEQNTANLYTVVDMISQSNDNQDKLIAIISEILMIAKAKEQAEADSLFKKAITAINDTVETAESIAKLYSWATMVYKIVTTTILK